MSVGESDTIITVLTRDYGVIRGFVRGARKIKSNYLSATQPLCYSRFSVFRGRDKYIFDEAEPIEVFFNLRKDIEKLALAQYLCDLARDLAPQEDSAESFLRLLLNSLHLLSTGKYEPLHIKATYEMRVMAMTGYMPNLVACENCGEYETDEMYFDFQHALLYCENCVPKNQARKTTLGVVTAMRHIVFSELDKLFAFTLNEENMKELSYVCENYLLIQTQHKYKTLDFYNSLFKI